ncbi:MAG: hypothetical protein HQK85_06695 [Nitrospinae bacterium]|nr:hypothetical protein [Nitrospinota bacterium]
MMGCEVVAEPSNGRESVELFKKTHPMLSLLDLNMPPMTGKEALVEILSQFPNAITIIPDFPLGNFQGLKMGDNLTGSQNSSPPPHRPSKRAVFSPYS